MLSFNLINSSLYWQTWISKYFRIECTFSITLLHVSICCPAFFCWKTRSIQIYSINYFTILQIAFLIIIICASPHQSLTLLNNCDIFNNKTRTMSRLTNLLVLKISWPHFHVATMTIVFLFNQVFSMSFWQL